MITDHLTSKSLPLICEGASLYVSLAVFDIGLTTFGNALFPMAKYCHCLEVTDFNPFVIIITFNFYVGCVLCLFPYFTTVSVNLYL